MLIAGCLTSAGFLLWLPLQSGKGLWIGTMQERAILGQPVEYPQIAEWIAVVGDTVAIDQLIGYTTNRQERLPLEAILNLHSEETRDLGPQLNEILEDSGPLPERIRLWIDTHLHKANRSSQKRSVQTRPSSLIRLNETLRGVETQLAQKRRERMNQSGSVKAATEIPLIRALEKQQMDLIQKIKDEIIRSESTPPSHQELPQWTLSAAVDSLVILVQMELKQMEVRADQPGVLVLGNPDSNGRRLQIRPMHVPGYVLELASRDEVVLSVGQEVDLMIELDDKHTRTPAGIRFLEQRADSVRVGLEIRDIQKVPKLDRPVQAGIRIGDQSQTRLIDLLAEKTYK